MASVAVLEPAQESQKQGIPLISYLYMFFFIFVLLDSYFKIFGKCGNIESNRVVQQTKRTCILDDKKISFKNGPFWILAFRRTENRESS